MSWINLVTPISTAVLAVLTFFYVVFTYKLLSEANRPEVVVFLEFLESDPKLQNKSYLLKLRICIQNAGLRTARKVRFDGDLDFKPVGRKSLNEFDQLENGIDILVPGQTVILGVASSPYPPDILNEDYYENRGSKVKIEVEYKSTGKRKYEDNFTLDFLKWNSAPKINNQ